MRHKFKKGDPFTIEMGRKGGKTAYKKHPEVFANRAKQSRDIGAKLVRYNGKRMFLDELPDGATGRPMKKMDFECSLFCEERI